MKARSAVAGPRTRSGRRQPARPGQPGACARPPAARAMCSCRSRWRQSGRAGRLRGCRVRGGQITEGAPHSSAGNGYSSGLSCSCSLKSRDRRSLSSGALATTAESRKVSVWKGVGFARTRYRSAMVCRQEQANVPNRRAENIGHAWITIFYLLVFRYGTVRRL